MVCKPRLFSYLFVTALSLGTVACAGSGSGEAAAWHVVNAEEANVILNAPGLEDANVKIQRREEGWEIQEDAHWQAARSSWPEAVLFLRMMRDVAPSSLHFAASKPMSDSVAAWFRGEQITMLGGGTTSNDLGDIEFQRFKRFEVIDCVLVRQGRSTYSDQITLPSGRDPLGDIVLVGWYCTDGRVDDADGAIAGFIAGIGLRGFTEP